jgi:hypothetical protein
MKLPPGIEEDGYAVYRIRQKLAPHFDTIVDSLLDAAETTPKIALELLEFAYPKQKEQPQQDNGIIDITPEELVLEAEKLLPELARAGVDTSFFKLPHPRPNTTQEDPAYRQALDNLLAEL